MRSTDARTDVVAKEGEGKKLGWQLGHVPLIEDYRAVMAQRAVFQSVASMGLPAFTIHSIVRYSGKALRNAKNPRLRSYGPIGVCFFAPLLLFRLILVVIYLLSRF